MATPKRNLMFAAFVTWMVLVAAAITPFERKARAAAGRGRAKICYDADTRVLYARKACKPGDLALDGANLGTLPGVWHGAAHVSEKGALVSGSAGTQVSRLEQGRYEVSFSGVSLEGCVAVVTQTPDGQGGITASVAPYATVASSSVFVSFFDVSAVSWDSGFMLQVNCP